MTHNSFEKQIKEKLSQAEVNPSDGLLDAIFEKRAASAKPFLGIGYTKLFLVAAVVAITSGIWYFNSNESNSTQLANQNTTASPTENNTDALASQSSKNETSKDNSNVLTHQPTEKQSSIASEKNTKNAKLANQSNRNNSRLKAVGSQPTFTSSIKSADAQDGNNQLSSHITKAPKLGHWNGENADPNAYFNVDAKNRPIIDYALHKGNSHLFVYESVDPTIIENEGLRYSGTTNIQKHQHIFDFETASLVEKNQNGLKLNGKNEFPIFIDVLYTPGLTNVSHKKDESLNFSSMNRNSFSQQFGLRASTPLFSRFTAFAGVSMLNLNANYNGNLQYQEPGQIIHKNVTYINDPIKGVITVVTYDTVNATLNKSKNMNFKNTYSVLRLPLGLGYNFGVNKFDFGINLSADFNLLTHSKVTTNLRETQTSIKSTNSKSLSLGAGLSFMAAYKISPRFRLIVEPGMHYMHLNAAKTGFDRNERILNLTTTFGIRYSLF